MWIAVFIGSGLNAAVHDMAANGAAGSYTYIVVLNAASDSREPDIPALGGEVLQRAGNRRVVRISATGIRALAAHHGVKYIQRVQVDDALPPLPSAPRLAATAVETNSSPSPTWYSGQYVYDGDGNITAIGTVANQSSDGGAESYVYDSATRLVQATIDHGTTDTEKYTYDSFGNLVDTTRTASPSTATPASPATNRLTGFTYDTVGNALSEGGSTSYVWDGLNMMRAKVKSTETALYVYTADDERIGVFENGEQRWMIRDLGGKVLRAWEVTGSVWMWREDHVYRNGALAAGEREPAEGGTRHFHLDHLGTPRLITDSNATRISAHDYFPFGLEKTDFRQEIVERGTNWPEPMKFTGHERDFSGGISSNNRNQLDSMHARYYSPVWGRFLTVDPAVESIDLTLPQTWNRYSYVISNPLLYIDPSGAFLQFANDRARGYYNDYLATLDPESQDYKNAKQLESSDVTYVLTVGKMDGKKEGEVGFDGTNVLLQLDSGGPAQDASMNSRMAHEIQHGVQVDEGRLGFGRNADGTWRPLFGDVHDEVEAWEAQLRQASNNDYFTGTLRGFKDAANKARYLSTHGYPGYQGKLNVIANAPAVSGHAPGSVLRGTATFWRIPR